MTLVGIVLSSYNRPDGLLEAVDSLTRQEHEDWVCVIADDHSEDPRVAEVLRLAETDPRFMALRGHRRYSLEEKDRVCTLGLRINEAQGLLRTRGVDLYSYLLDDVVYHPTRLKRHVEVLQDHPDAALVWGEQWLVRRDETGVVVEERRQVPERGLSDVRMPYLRARLGQGNNFINHCSATHRPTSAQWSTRPQDCRLVDLRFWQSMVHAGAERFIHVDEVGETMHSGPWDIGPMFQRGATMTDVARARGGK